MPTNITARPTTDFARENIFNILENMIDFEDDEPTALDLFAGTGAITLEFLSRGCSSVTTVEKAATQYNFIRKVAQQLNVDNLTLIKGDALRYIESATQSFDIVFADPPYDLPGFGDIPQAVLNSRLLHEGSVFVIEHSKKHDFSSLPHFVRHVAYGSVNFSIFVIQNEDTSSKNNDGNDAESDE